MGIYELSFVISHLLLGLVSLSSIFYMLGSRTVYIDKQILPTEATHMRVIERHFKLRTYRIDARISREFPDDYIEYHLEDMRMALLSDLKHLIKVEKLSDVPYMQDEVYRLSILIPEEIK